MKSTLLIPSLTLALALILAGSVRADSQSSGTFTSDFVLNLAGTETYGVNLDGTAEMSANQSHYTFSAFSGQTDLTDSNHANYESFLGGGGTSGDSSFDAVLTSGFYGSVSSTITLDNLKADTTYNALFLDADTRPEAHGVTFTLEDGSSQTITQEYGFVAGTPSLGGYILDQFTTGANQTSATFTVSTSGTSKGQLDGFLLGTGPAAPEPSIYALLGLGALALFLLGRRLSLKS